MAGQQKTDDARLADADLIAVRDSMVDGVGQLAEYFGFSKVMGQLYTALLMSPRPLSLDDLMAVLDISKASVSVNMRTLEHMGMVRQAWVRGRGDRRKFYEAETDFWDIIANILSGREMRDVERALAVMNEGVERLSASMVRMDEADRQVAQLYLERIGQMQGLFRFAQLIIRAILADAGEMDFEDISGVEIQVDSEPGP